ncbi:Ig-like domain-containing protein (plasmid) [Klebsiella pneumoniae]|nr:Ig-like domain-containing protein [Klebsiella pneumoniae]
MENEILKKATVDSIGQRNSYVKTWGCGGFLLTSGGLTNDATPALSGTAEAGSTVTIYDGSTVLGTAVADEDGHWRFTPGFRRPAQGRRRIIGQPAAGQQPGVLRHIIRHLQVADRRHGGVHREHREGANKFLI